MSNEQEPRHGEVITRVTPLARRTLIGDAHGRPLRVGDIVRIKGLDHHLEHMGKVLRLSTQQGSSSSPKVDVRFASGEVRPWWADGLVIEQSAEHGPTPDGPKL